MKGLRLRRLQREVVEVLAEVLQVGRRSRRATPASTKNAVRRERAAGRVEHLVARLARERAWSAATPAIGLADGARSVIERCARARSDSRSSRRRRRRARAPAGSTRPCDLTLNGVGDLGLGVALLAVVDDAGRFERPVAQRRLAQVDAALAQLRVVPRAAARSRAPCPASCDSRCRRCRRGRARCRTTRRSAAGTAAPRARCDVHAARASGSPVWPVAAAGMSQSADVRRRRGLARDVDHREGAGVVEIAPRPAQRREIERLRRARARAARGPGARWSCRCPRPRCRRSTRLRALARPRTRRRPGPSSRSSASE